MKKFLLGLLTVLFLSLPIQAKAECSDPFPEFVASVTSNQNVKVRPLTSAEETALYAAKGPPPVEPPFTLSVADNGQLGMLLVVKDDCIVAKIGLVPLEMLNILLGHPDA